MMLKLIAVIKLQQKVRATPHSLKHVKQYVAQL